MSRESVDSYGEFAISRPTLINVSTEVVNPAFEIKPWVLYLVLSNFAPPQKNKDLVALFGFVQRGGGIKRMTF